MKLTWISSGKTEISISNKKGIACIYVSCLILLTFRLMMTEKGRKTSVVSTVSYINIDWTLPVHRHVSR